MIKSYTKMTEISEKYSVNIKINDEIINIPQKDESLVEYYELENDEPIILKKNYHDSVFIKILDNTPPVFNFNQLILMLNKGYEYFDKLEISVKIKNRINAWVKNLGKYSYTWVELLDKPNYGLEVFKTRFWPFFNVENKDWKLISTNVLSTTYPSQQDCINLNKVNDINEIIKDYKIEYGISQKYNNFLGYSVMKPEDYPNMDNIITKLQTLKKLKLDLLMFEAILRLFITPTTCHIIKNYKLWELVNPLFEDSQFGMLYQNIFYHFMYYAMFILNHEDMIMFSKIQRNYRIIFTHAEALNMPQTYKLHIELDPYIQQLTGETYLVQSIPYYLRCKRYLHPINIFERRFFLATGGALANIPLHKFNAAVSGSILIPCMSYSNLEKDFQNIRYKTKRIISGQVAFNDNMYKFCDETNAEERDFLSYLEYYYPSYHSLTDNDFIDRVLTQSATVEKTVDITEEKTEKDYKLKYNLLSDIDISITTDNYETFDELAQILAKSIQINCKRIGEVWIKKVYTAATFKYKIYGPGLIRNIDLFRVPYGPDKMVKKFHCPIVRAWYDGKNENNRSIYQYNHTKDINEYWKNKTSTLSNESYDIIYPDEDINEDMNESNNKDTTTTEPVNLSSESTEANNTEKPLEENNQYYIGLNIIRSCLCAVLSGVNNDYKWFFNSKPCVEVILKYAQRGFSTIINEKEKLAMIEYMKISPRWNHYIKKNIDIMGMMTQSHLFFSPCIVNAGIRYKLRKFKKSHIKVYNSKQHVGLPKTKTDYGVDLVIKDNTKVYHPDINKMNMFMNYMEQVDQEEFSDGDEF